MRTTLTLEPDIYERLQELSRKKRKSFKAVVNETLRLGLSAPRQLEPAGPFRVEARDLGLRPGIQLDNIGELLEQLEGPGSP